MYWELKQQPLEEEQQEEQQEEGKIILNKSNINKDQWKMILRYAEQSNRFYMTTGKIFYSSHYVKIILSQILLSVIIGLVLMGISGCSASNKEDINVFLNQNMEKAGFVGLQAAYVKDGVLAWSGSFGKKNLNNAEEVNDTAPSSFGTMKIFYMDMVKRLLNEARK